MGDKPCPTVILEGTRLTRRTDIAFALERAPARGRAAQAPPPLAARVGGVVRVHRLPVGAYLSWRTHERVETVAQFLRVVAAAWASGEGHRSWLLRRRDTGELVGSIGVETGHGKAVFGYVLGRAHWGQGLAAEALTWLVDWALSQPGIVRAWAHCDVDNAASARVMEKAGMTREGILRRWQALPNIGPEPRDCVVYAPVK